PAFCRGRYRPLVFFRVGDHSASPPVSTGVFKKTEALTMGSMITWRNISASATGLLAVCGMAAGQAFTANFEAPTYTGSAAGKPTTDNTLGGSRHTGRAPPHRARS